MCRVQLTCGPLAVFLPSYFPTSQSSLENTVRTPCEGERERELYVHRTVAPTDLDQVHIILNVIGSPSQDDLTSVTSEQVSFLCLQQL